MILIAVIMATIMITITVLTDMHESNPSLVSPGIVEIMEDRHQQIQHIAALEKILFLIFLNFFL